MTVGAVTTSIAGTCSVQFLSLPVILLLATLVLVIVILLFFLVHYRHRLNRTRESLVRYICVYLSVKDFVPSDKRPVVNRMKDPVSPAEFIQIINRMLKRMMLLPLVMLMALPLWAQSPNAEADSVYEFRFVPQKDVFFIPYKGNQSQMQRLSLFIEQYRQEIADGRLPLHVDGYCSSLSGTKANLAVARLRSNRVKSELIQHNGMREEYFITRNHAEGGDFVTVRILFPAASAEEVKETAVQPKEENASAATEQAVTEKEQTESAATSSVLENTVPADLQSASYTLSLRANLLRWATLTPDLGLEWRISRNIGILVNGSWTSWSWDNKNRRYALWRVSPEVRYYICNEKRAYLGAMYRFGEFNYKLGNTGKQGDLQGGGITGGWQLPIGKRLAIDFSLGLGYIRTDYDKYEVIDGVRVRQGSESKNWWGPVSAGVTLMWKLF